MDINRPNSPNSFLPLYSNNSVNCANSSNNLSTKLQNSIDINSTCNNDEDTDITANNKTNIQKLETFNNPVVSINHQNNIDNTSQRNNKSDNNVRNDVEKCYNNQQSAAISNGYLKEAETDYNPEKGESFNIASTSNNENAENDCNVITNALNKDFSNAFIPAYSTNGRLYESEGLSHDKPMYNEFVNKTYTDTSRRESLQPVDEEVLHLLNTIQSTDQNNLIQVTDPTKPLLAVCQTTNEKHLKSIVKSPSSQSVGISSCTTTATRKSRPKPALQCLNPDGHVRELPDSEATTPTAAGEFERPVLHVQFMPNDDGINPTGQGDSANCNFGSHNRRRSDCRSPIGSISSGSTGTSSSSSDDDNSSIGQYSEARAPDGGWGWVVVFASFIVNLIADGVTFSFGVIFVEFLNYFGKGKAKTAWIGSLFMAIPLLSGPIASFLTDRYGCRKVTIAGSILACIGFVISSFSNSMEMLFFTFGILAGFGLSLCYVAAVVIVAYYFEKKRSFATGLSVCGSGIGTFIFAPLTQLLLDEYGWRGTTLILAGIFLNMCVCGMLMRDLEWTTHRAKLKAKERKQSKLGVSADSFSVSNSTNTGGTTSILNQPLTSTAENGGSNNNGSNGVKIDDHFDDPRLFSSLITLPTFVRNGERVPLEVLELLSTHRNVHNLLQNYPSLLHSRSFSEPLSSRNAMTSDAPMSPNKLDDPNTSVTSDKANCNTEEYRKEQALLAWIKKNGEHHSRDSRHHPSAAYLKDLRIHRHSLTYRGAMLNINRYRLRASSCPDIYRNSMTTIAKEKTAWYQGIDEFKNLFVDILDISYFADMRFLLFAFSNFLLYTWYDVPYVYLTDNAIEMGIEETDASMLIGIIGIVNMFGEIALGWIGDVKGISASLVYAVCMALCGAVTAMVPLSNSYTWLCSISGLFGLFIAANYALTSIILVELITLERFTNAYGLLLLVQGVANLVGPPLAGWIYDVTGTYDLSFYVAGFFISISGGMLFILPALGKYRKYRALRRQNLPDKIKTPKMSKAPALNKDSDATNKYNGTTILSDCFNKELLKETVKANHV